MKKEKQLKKYFKESNLSALITINDLEEKELNGIPLSNEEERAILAFRRMRLQKLSNRVNNEAQFNEQFEYMQVLGNIVDYREFLNEKSDLL